MVCCPERGRARGEGGARVGERERSRGEPGPVSAPRPRSPESRGFRKRTKGPIHDQETEAENRVTSPANESNGFRAELGGSGLMPADDAFEPCCQTCRAQEPTGAGVTATQAHLSQAPALTLVKQKPRRSCGLLVGSEKLIFRGGL